MSLEAWGDGPWDEGGPTVEESIQNAFVDGAQACRELMARFVENAGDAQTAASIRANWHPEWGDDPGPLTEIPVDACGMTAEGRERARANFQRELDKLDPKKSGQANCWVPAALKGRGGA
jgi:hypothetical protein